MHLNQILIADNVFVKMMYLLKEGDIVEGHAHTFDHITLLSAGSVQMARDDKTDTFTAPCLIVTPKGVRHKFTALRDNVVLCCIHAVRDGDGVDDIAPQNISINDAGKLLSEFPVVEVG